MSRDHTPEELAAYEAGMKTAKHLLGSKHNFSADYVGTAVTQDALAAYARTIAAARAEGVAALQQGGESVAWAPHHHKRHPWAQPGDAPNRIWIMRFDDQDMREMVWHDENAEADAKAAYEKYSPAWNVYLFATVPTSPLPQQTALVEQGVEKIMAQHEPAACGASAPSEPPRSDGWRVKDHADDWIVFATGTEALAEVAAMGGALVEPIPQNLKGACG